MTLAMDHTKLTFFFNGRHMRLTNIAGELIPQITGAAGSCPSLAGSHDFWFWHATLRRGLVPVCEPPPRVRFPAAT